MKALSIIAKIVAALVAAAGAVYVAATYGDQIVAWAKKTLASLSQLGCCEEECAPAEEPAAEEEPAPAEEEPATEEPAPEEEPAAEEEPAPAEEEPAEAVAEESDFED